jgi:hypothetical protein
VKPVLQSIVVADHVYEDKTGKKIIAGTFNSYGFSRTPPVREVDRPDGTRRQILLGGMQAGSPFAYLSLTDVCEGTKLSLQFVSYAKNAVLFGSEFTVNKADRLSTIELVFPLPRLPISEPGTYALEVVWEGEILGSWRIVGFDLDEKRKG